MCNLYFLFYFPFFLKFSLKCLRVQCWFPKTEVLNMTLVIPHPGRFPQTTPVLRWTLDFPWFVMFLFFDFAIKLEVLWSSITSCDNCLPVFPSLFSRYSSKPFLRFIHHLYKPLFMFWEKILVCSTGGLKLRIPLPHFSECWNSMCVAAYPTSIILKSFSTYVSKPRAFYLTTVQTFK